jgi:RHS repeat-associated protein
MRSLSARIGHRAPRFAQWVAALLIAAPLPVHAQSETVEYYALDAVGSVRVVFDASGNIVGRMDYAPFGGELSGGTKLPDQRFAGLFRDGEAGLDYAQARSYQVRTGRFNAPDPMYAGMFDPQGWNRYAYALNNPLRFVDRSGLNSASATSLAPGSCPAEYSLAECGGDALFWKVGVQSLFDDIGGGGGGLPGFGYAYAEAVRNGYNPAMPGEFWVGLQTMNANANAAFAQAAQSRQDNRPPRPGVSTTSEVTQVIQPDGTKIPVELAVRDATALDAIAEAGRVAAPFTSPQVYGEILAASMAGGVCWNVCGPGYAAAQRGTQSAAIALELAVPGTIAYFYEGVSSALEGSPPFVTNWGGIVAYTYQLLTQSWVLQPMGGR